jgi:hypothetical protein
LVSARSLRPGGATTLLCAGVNPDAIQLLGRWKSDFMLRYLRVAAQTNTGFFAARMLAAGAFTFAPNTPAVSDEAPIPKQAPAAFLQASLAMGL